MVAQTMNRVPRRYRNFCDDSMLTAGRAASKAGLDAVALKPAECDVRETLSVLLDAVTIDYEGRERLPDEDVLRDLTTEKETRLTTPVRTDGLDPFDDDSLYEWLSDGVRQVLVAGHGAYLVDDEARHAVAPRLRVARERAPDAWVGTEGIERIALAAGGTQYELLSRLTRRDVRASRAAGFGGEVALYAPTALTDDDDEVLDAVGAYVSRRRPVARMLPDDVATDASAEGRVREVFLKASRDHALIGSVDDIRRRIDDLRDVGTDLMVGYPARDVDEFVE